MLLNKKLSWNWMKKNEHYPLLIYIANNDNEMINLLMEYANKHNIILELNGKNNKGQYPIFYFLCYCLSGY